MSGVVAVRQVLVGSADLVALVPATRIGAGVLPQGTPLPAISLESVSKTDRNIPNPGPWLHVTERVQITVLARDYDSQAEVLAEIRRALRAERFPAVAGLERVTVHTDSAGPDFMNEDATIHMGTQDAKVTYSEPA